VGLEVSVARVRSLGSRVDTRFPGANSLTRTEQTRIGWDGMKSTVNGEWTNAPAAAASSSSSRSWSWYSGSQVVAIGRNASLERFNGRNTVRVILCSCWGRCSDWRLHKAKRTKRGASHPQCDGGIDDRSGTEYVRCGERRL